MGLLGDILAHPDELMPLLRMREAAKKAAQLPSDPSVAFCYDMLLTVSRSFAVVIQQLPNPLRDAICIFYLVLRGLDTVEDDMALDDVIKVPALLAFHKNISKKNFTIDCGYNHYKRLMNQFGTVIEVFLSLDKGFQAVIADITKRMGEGMAEFIQKDVKTVADYDKYCHYVAGLVGIGLSHLFASSGLEDESFNDTEDIANHMGLFLQKTNIIRDYLEDIMEEPAPRMFWPKAIWGKYAAKLEDFKVPAEREPAVQCLNHMILDALRHLPFCIEYMRKLRNRMVFRFCAIPQIMAIGTLAVCFNNGKLFEGVVKMRRGQTAKVFDSCDNMGDLIAWFEKFLLVLEAKINNELSKDDPNYSKLKKIVEGHKELCKEEMREWKEQYPSPPAPVLSITTDLALGTAMSALVYQQYLTPSFNYMIMLIALIWLFVMKRLVF